jgi:hypothetical protein
MIDRRKLWLLVLGAAIGVPGPAASGQTTNVLQIGAEVLNTCTASTGTTGNGTRTTSRCTFPVPGAGPDHSPAQVSTQRVGDVVFTVLTF